jgi:hypothetical protein
MFGLFAYVDISWDARNMTLLAFALAGCVYAPLGTGRRPTPAPGEESRSTDRPRGVNDRQPVLAHAS